MPICRTCDSNGAGEDECNELQTSLVGDEHV